MFSNLFAKLLARIPVFAARPQTVGSYLFLHPEINEFWLQAGRNICKHNVKRDMYGWRKYKKEPIIWVEYLKGEPVVLHINENGMWRG